MARSSRHILILLAVGALTCALIERAANAAGAPLPNPAVDETPSGANETVVFAGGCFWGIQAVFEHIKGVTKATAGYSGGTLKNPSYEEVSSGTTGHAGSNCITRSHRCQT